MRGFQLHFNAIGDERGQHFNYFLDGPQNERDY